MIFPWCGRLARILDRWLFPIIQGSKWVAMVALIVTMFFVTINVATRYCFNLPIMGYFEIVQLLGVLIVFPALGYTIDKGSAVSLTLLTDRLPSSFRTILGNITSFLNIGIVALISWRNFRAVIQRWQTGQETIELLIPLFPFFFILAFGAAILCLKLVANYFRSLSEHLGR